jgi:hypothetical protein
MPKHTEKERFKKRAMSIAADQARQHKIEADTESARRGRKETEEERKRRREEAARKARRGRQGKLPGGGA